MIRGAKRGGTILAVAILIAPAFAADAGRWIHVRVDENGEHGAKVDVQVPLSMVSSLMPTLKTKIDLDGDLDFGHGKMTVAEMRDAWAAVKHAKDGNYVTIRDASGTVRVAKRAGVVHVEVNGDGGSERVTLRLPVALVDAALGSGEQLDVPGLLEALSDVPSGELIAVDDDESKIRIWIDDRPDTRDDRP
jgi:hypothetical protein